MYRKQLSFKMFPLKNVLEVHHSGNTWASSCIKSVATQLFFWHLVQANNKETSNLQTNGSLYGEFKPWFLLIKEQQCGKHFHVDGFVQERDNSIANALELRLSCTKLSMPWCIPWCIPENVLEVLLQNGWCLTHCGAGDAMLWHISRSTLTQVMVCCMTAASHYQNQCWLVNMALQHSSEGKSIGNVQDINQWTEFENQTFKCYQL